MRRGSTDGSAAALCPATAPGRRIVSPCSDAGWTRDTPPSGSGCEEICVSSEGDSSPQSYTGTERILAFSDGVFAIAITLLVLDLTPPRVEHGVIRKLLDAWPNYLSY